MRTYFKRLAFWGLFCGAFLLVLRSEAQTPTSAKASPTSPAVPDQISIVAFGGKGDGAFDNTAAFESAVRAASAKSQSIYFPCGIFRFVRKPVSLPSGIRLVGCGSVGSNEQYGSNLLVDYDEPQPEVGFLTWDGSFGRGQGKCCAGTGGGIDHLIIVKATHRSGGTAIKLTGSEDNYRAGFFNIDDVMVHAAGDGSWQHDLVIDGTCCKTPNSQGVRDTHITDFFAAQAVSGDQAVLFKNATQVFWYGGMIFPAKSAKSSGLTITGLSESPYLASTNIFISDVYMTGGMVIDNARNVIFSGMIGGDLRVSSAAKMAMISGLIGGEIVNNSTTATILSAKGIDSSSAALKHKRLEVGLRPGAKQTFKVGWDLPFPDTHYTASVQILDASGQVRIIGMQSQAADSITVMLENLDKISPHSVVIHATGAHD